MEFYFLQEKIDSNIWFDLYTNDLSMLKEMILVLREKNKDKFYRIVRLYK